MPGADEGRTKLFNLPSPATHEKVCLQDSGVCPPVNWPVRPAHQEDVCVRPDEFDNGINLTARRLAPNAHRADGFEVLAVVELRDIARPPAR